jgi:hypothetical protein
MIAAYIDKLNCCAAELYGLLLIHYLVRYHDSWMQRVLLLQFQQALLGSLMGNEDCAKILEGLAACDMVIVVVTVNYVVLHADFLQECHQPLIERLRHGVDLRILELAKHRTWPIILDAGKTFRVSVHKGPSGQINLGSDG